MTFLTVYIREAHPEDGWVLEENRDGGIAVTEPRTAAERAQLAKLCAEVASTGATLLVDDMDNSTALAYGAWPDRLYLVDVKGRIAYQGGEGPYGFLPEELAAAIERLG